MDITILLCAVIVLLVFVILIPSKPKLRSAAAYWQKIGEGVPLGLNALAADAGDMITTIFSVPVCDGYDVLLSDGTVVHFTTRPADLDAAVAEFLAARDAAVVQYDILGESDA